MCSLCGILGGKAHWTDSSGAPEVFGDRDAGRTVRRDRLDRAGLVNKVLAPVEPELATADAELTLNSLNFHHMMFFDKNNYYIGYINGNGSNPGA